jgi:hypothetical protein
MVVSSCTAYYIECSFTTEDNLGHEIWRNSYDRVYTGHNNG